MKQFLIAISLLTITLNANAEITCIGRLGGIDSRVTIWYDGLDKIEIRQAGENAYTGNFKEDRLGVPTGKAKSPEGNEISFDYELNYHSKTKSNTMEIGIERATGKVSGGKLNCVVLD